MPGGSQKQSSKSSFIRSIVPKSMFSGIFYNKKQSDYSNFQYKYLLLEWSFWEVEDRRVSCIAP